jgi:hypothetical protein
VKSEQRFEEGCLGDPQFERLEHEVNHVLPCLMLTKAHKHGPLLTRKKRTIAREKMRRREWFLARSTIIRTQHGRPAECISQKEKHNPRLLVMQLSILSFSVLRNWFGL